MLENLFCFRIELVCHLMDLILVPAIFTLHPNFSAHSQNLKISFTFSAFHREYS
jgi:hypothetical protein